MPPREARWAWLAGGAAFVAGAPIPGAILMAIGAGMAASAYRRRRRIEIGEEEQ